MKTKLPKTTVLALLGAMLAVLLAPSVHAAETENDPEQRPKLALVLSGGGARGIAHVGVLKVLEELHVVPDLVVGTSMGAVIGGLYCAGWTPQQIEELVHRIDWEQIFNDSVARKDLSFRRKQDDRPVMVQGRLHFKGLKPVLPSGVIRGQKLELLLRTLEALSVPSSDFDRLPIPYRAVAADIATGEAVVIGSGSLATAMRASMSIPGAFPPVELGGRELVDGGISANLPVGIARTLGAETIIAVDISSPLLSEGEKLGSFLAIYNHLNSLLTASNVERDIALLGPKDVLLRPDLGDISFVAFDRVGEATELGEKEARARADELRRFAVSDEEWAALSKHPTARLNQPIEVDRLRIDNTSRINDKIVRKTVSIHPPESLDTDVMALDLLELYNTRYFGTIAFKIEEDGGENELVIETPEPEYGRGSLQFGIGILDDFEGGSGYHILVRHQLLPANRRGGEWQNIVQVGTRSIAATEFYQPLDAAMMWFVDGSLGFDRETIDLWFDGHPVAEYILDTAKMEVAAGRVLGKWGELRLTAFSGNVHGSPRLGDPDFPSDSERRGGAELGFRVDTVDEVVFPRSGTEVWARYTRSSEALGADNDFEHVWGSVAHSWSFGEFTMTPYLEYGKNLEPADSIVDLFALGGIGRLSGLGADELRGEEVLLARLLAFRRLWHMDVAGLTLQFLAGLSLEAGNTYNRHESISFDSLVMSGAAFVGANTPVGPAYLAYGYADGGRDRWYLVIGDRF